MKGTIFCDIDGTILYFVDTWEEMCTRKDIPTLEEVKEKMIEWCRQGYIIYLTTARPEGLRNITIEQLAFNNIPYHHLIMNLPDGPRILINDLSPSKPSEKRAIAINVERNKGFKDIDL